MTLPFRSRFRTKRNGGLTFRLEPNERELVGDLLEQVRQLLMGTAAKGAVDPTLRRLYPTAYPEDSERDADFQSLVRDELLERRLEHIDQVEATLDATELNESQALAWLTVLNDLRLVLGTSLDVSEDDTDRLAPNDPNELPRAIYDFLSALQADFVRALDT